MDRAFVVVYRESHWSGWYFSDTEWESFDDAAAEAKQRVDHDGIYLAAVVDYDRDDDVSLPRFENAVIYTEGRA